MQEREKSRAGGVYGGWGSPEIDGGNPQGRRGVLSCPWDVCRAQPLSHTLRAV